MQITNNTNTNFKAARIQKCAKVIALKRMSEAKFKKLEKDFIEKYKDSEFTIDIGAAESNRRLDAKISFNDKSTKEDKCIFFRYLEEGIFSSLFRSPKAFFEKIDRAYKESAVPFAQNGFKHTV